MFLVKQAKVHEAAQTIWGPSRLVRTSRRCRPKLTEKELRSDCKRLHFGLRASGGFTGLAGLYNHGLFDKKLKKTS